MHARYEGLMYIWLSRRGSLPTTPTASAILVKCKSWSGARVYSRSLFGIGVIPWFRLIERRPNVTELPVNKIARYLSHTRPDPTRGRKKERLKTGAFIMPVEKVHCQSYLQLHKPGTTHLAKRTELVTDLAPEYLFAASFWVPYSLAWRRRP